MRQILGTIDFMELLGLTSLTERKEHSMEKIALSDVDGTIIRGSLVLDHACSLHEQGIVDLGDHPENWRADQKNEAKIVALAEAYKTALVGKRQSELGVSKYLDTLFADESKFYSTLERLKELQAQGAEIHLISGSPSFLVGPFARRLGMRHAGSLYSRTRPGHFTGVVRLMAVGGAKRDYVASLNVDRYDEVHAFGDTSSDAPLFDVAHYSTLVDPSPHTESLFAGKVSSIIRD